MDATPVRVEHSAIRSLVVDAQKTLSDAKSAATILDAMARAQIAIDTAKRAARFAKAQGAHDDLVGAARRLQGEATDIEAQAKIRLAEEYDAAQERGEVAGHGRSKVEDPNLTATLEELGLRKDQIHEARILRDGEAAEPGVVKKTILQLLDEGHEPTRTAVREACIDAATRALKGGGETRGSKRNPFYAPNPVRDALLAITGSCEEITRKGNEFSAAQIASAFVDDAEKGRGQVKVAKAIDVLRKFQREIAP